nr:stage II sporulation protein M [uncultured Flavobacterium sp.]
MKLYILSLSIFLSGFILCLITYDVQSVYTYSYNFTHSDINNFNTGFLFVDIFINNIILCLIISILGFISGGILTIVLLFWNGYLLAIFLNAGFSDLSLYELMFLSKHIPLEIFSILLFAKFSFNGFFFYRSIIIEKKIKFISKREIINLIYPIILLFFSSIIETL